MKIVSYLVAFTSLFYFAFPFLQTLHLFNTSKAAPASLERVVVPGAALAWVPAAGTSNTIRISPNGRFVAFRSNFLFPDSGDTTSGYDVFVYDQQDGSIEVVGDIPNGYIWQITDDGRYVLVNTATDHVPEDTNGGMDLYLYDRVDDSYVLITKTSGGVSAGFSGSAASMSADMRYFAYQSASSDVVPGFGEGVGMINVFLYDRTLDITVAVSKKPDGTEPVAFSTFPAVSLDGNFVAYQSAASDIIAGDTNGETDIFVYDINAGTNERVSVSSAAAEADSDSYTAQISGDGRFVTFTSTATNLVAGDTNGFLDVFIHDRDTAQTERVSVSSAGAEGNNHSDIGAVPSGVFTFPTLSNDGRYVLFTSQASNLVPDDTNAEWDAFLYDRNTDTIRRVNVDDNGVEANRRTLYPYLAKDGTHLAFSTMADNFFTPDNTSSYDVYYTDIDGNDPLELISGKYSVEGGTAASSSNGNGLSASGQHLVFTSASTNFVPGDTNSRSDVFVYTQATGALERVSVNDLGVQGNGWSYGGVISDDGRYVAFSSEASNLIGSDSNGVEDIFVYDRDTDTIERVSISSLGEEADDYSYGPQMSGDARYISFTSSATNLVPDDTNGMDDVFVYDRTLDEIERVSISSLGAEGDDWPSYSTISDDGRFVAFESYATNLVPDDTNDTQDIFVYDRTNDTIEVVSVNDLGVLSNGYSESPTLSADGRYVSFDSYGSNLVADDTGNDYDVFVYDRDTDTIERVNLGPAGEETTGDTFTLPGAMSADGRHVAFYSGSSVLVEDDTNGATDTFVVDRDTDIVTRVSQRLDSTEGNGTSDNPAISPDGSYVMFATGATNLSEGDTNNVDDVYLASVPVGGVANSNPDDPGTLGGANLLDGSATDDNTPTFTFVLSDDDGADTVKYQIQIDDTADFSSPVVDYTSALAAQGAASFTVGQAAGGGTYTAGSEGQSLSDSAGYYWRVKAIDNSDVESAYVTANGGAIAFSVDTSVDQDTGSSGTSGYYSTPTPSPTPTPTAAATPTFTPTPLPTQPSVPALPAAPSGADDEGQAQPDGAEPIDAVGSSEPTAVPTISPTPVADLRPCTREEKKQIRNLIKEAYYQSKKLISDAFRLELSAALDLFKQENGDAKQKYKDTVSESDRKYSEAVSQIKSRERSSVQAADQKLSAAKAAAKEKKDQAVLAANEKLEAALKNADETERNGLNKKESKDQAKRDRKLAKETAKNEKKQASTKEKDENKLAKDVYRNEKNDAREILKAELSLAKETAKEEKRQAKQVLNDEKQAARVKYSDSKKTLTETRKSAFANAKAARDLAIGRLNSNCTVPFPIPDINPTPDPVVASPAPTVPSQPETADPADSSSSGTPRDSDIPYEVGFFYDGTNGSGGVLDAFSNQIAAVFADVERGITNFYLDHTAPELPIAAGSVAELFPGQSTGMGITALAAASLPAATSTVVAAQFVGLGVRTVHYLRYMFLALLQLLGLRKRRKPWGLVFDSETLQPIPFAKVQVLSQAGKILETAITDKAGRYGFLVSPRGLKGEQQKIEFLAAHPKYKFPSRKTLAAYMNLPFNTVYTGGLVTITSDQTPNYDMPLDPVVRKGGKAPVRLIVNRAVAKFSSFTFWIGFPLAFTTYAAEFNPISFALIGLFALIAIARVMMLKPSPYGVVRDSSTGQPLPFATVVLLDERQAKQGFAVTDLKGRYFMIIPKGKYKMQVTAPSSVVPSRQVSKDVDAKEGWVSEDVRV